MTGLQLTDFELAVLIGVVLVGVILAVLLVRRHQPAPVRPAPTSSALPADLAAIEAEVAALKAEVAPLKGRMSEMEHGINQVRTMLRALPDKDSVHQLALSVSEVKGDLKLNNAQTEATAKTVERIMNWLMDDAKGKASSR